MKGGRSCAGGRTVTLLLSLGWAQAVTDFSEMRSKESLAGIN